MNNAVIYGPLRHALGLNRVRTAYVVGEAIGPDVLRFCRAIGLLYMQADGQARVDAVGPRSRGWA